MRLVRGMLVSVVRGQMGRFQATAGDKSLLLKAITILYDGTMKTLVTLLPACCFVGGSVELNLLWYGPMLPQALKQNYRFAM